MFVYVRQATPLTSSPALSSRQVSTSDASALPGRLVMPTSGSCPCGAGSQRASRSSLRPPRWRRREPRAGGCGAPVDGYSAWASRPRRRSSATALSAAYRELPMPRKTTRSASAVLLDPVVGVAARLSQAGVSRTSQVRCSGRRSAIVLQEPAHPRPRRVHPRGLEVGRVDELVAGLLELERAQRRRVDRAVASRKAARAASIQRSISARRPGQSSCSTDRPRWSNERSIAATSRRAVPGAARSATGRVGSPSKSSTRRRSPAARIWPMWKSPWTRWTRAARPAPRALRARRGCGSAGAELRATRRAQRRARGRAARRPPRARRGGRGAGGDVPIPASAAWSSAEIAPIRPIRPTSPAMTASPHHDQPSRPPGTYSWRSATPWPRHSTAPGRPGRSRPGRRGARRSRSRGVSPATPTEELHDDPFADDVGGVRLVDADGPLGLPARGPCECRNCHDEMLRDCTDHHNRGRDRPLRPT